MSRRGGGAMGRWGRGAVGTHSTRSAGVLVKARSEMEVMRFRFSTLRTHTHQYVNNTQ